MTSRGHGIIRVHKWARRPYISSLSYSEVPSPSKNNSSNVHIHHHFYLPNPLIHILATLLCLNPPTLICHGMYFLLCHHITIAVCHLPIPISWTVYFYSHTMILWRLSLPNTSFCLSIIVLYHALFVINLIKHYLYNFI